MAPGISVPAFEACGPDCEHTSVGPGTLVKSPQQRPKETMESCVCPQSALDMSWGAPLKMYIILLGGAL